MNETPDSPDVPPPPPPPPPPAAPPPPAPSATAGYPLQADIQHQAEYSRFMPLIKWLLLIPHYIALLFLFLAVAIVGLISFFAVIFTRRYPRGMYDFVVGVARWYWRVVAYLYLMTDQYPPFSLEDDPAQPARFNIEYPEGIDRWRPIVQWLIVIPYLIVANILAYLAEILVFFAFFTILFTKKFPAGMFNIVLIALRWQARGNAYFYWLTTKYPPFAWE